jgi:hypothetical protein
VRTAAAAASIDMLARVRAAPTCLNGAKVTRR